jgi:hypothetical protein
MSAQRQAKILGKIVGEKCKGKTAFYQGTMKDTAARRGLPPASTRSAGK